jgi:hypothetical protein
MAYTTIDKPDLYFNTKLYTGNSGTNAITEVNFQPDWIWIKERGASGFHVLTDAVRGKTKQLYSNDTQFENTNSSSVTAFDSDGFTLGNRADVNNNSDTYVAWNWLGSNTTASNTDGSITSTVSASTTSGFSIVSYTGTGANATVGTGLGATPKVVIVKNRDSGENWQVYHGSISGMSGGYITLNNTDGFLTNITNFWNGNHSSTIIDIGSNNGTNQSGNNFIAYCFAEKKGFSKFGSYTGNGSATDGTFVYTGMKPSFVMFKSTSTTGGWEIHDNKRDTFNPSSKRLFPHLSNAEATENYVDFTSQGFKFRTSDATGNTSGTKYIFMCFAESPFTTSTGIPTTAR